MEIFAPRFFDDFNLRREIFHFVTLLVRRVMVVASVGIYILFCFGIGLERKIDLNAGWHAE